MHLKIHIEIHIKTLGWPKSSFRFFCNSLWKNPNELFGQSNPIKRTEILWSIYDQNGIKLGINTEKVAGDSPTIWKLNTKIKVLFWKSQKQNKTNILN